MMVWHLTFSAEGRMPLMPLEGERREAVRALVRVAGPWLALFCIVDEHVHVVLVCDRARAGRLARAILLALRAVSRSELRPADIKAVESRGHASWLARHYIVAQPERHELPEPPALYSGSCFQDLAGARALPGLDLRIHEVLPRFQLGEIFTEVGLPGRQLVLPSREQLRARGMGPLAQASAAALCADPTLSGRPAEVAVARRAAARIADDAGIHRGEIAVALGVTPAGLRYLLGGKLDDAVLRAVRLRLALEAAVVQRPAARVPSPALAPVPHGTWRKQGGG